jgi:cellulose synthase/poly-beta-1,6-N-acetylglucosamine synthase-like glycosyltransferase
MAIPKILIAAPQHDSKKYCWDDWIKNVYSFNYPNVDVLLVDNSDTADFFEEMKSHPVYLHRIDVQGKTTLEKMTESHEFIRQSAIDNKYDYLLHLETDVFPSQDVIERLLFHNKQIISVPYNILSGAERELCIVYAEHDSILDSLVLYRKPIDLTILGNGVQQVFNAGIGCTLFKTSILNKFKFRFVQGVEAHPDTWLAYDMLSKNIPVYIDSDMLAQHKNSAFGWQKFN